MNNRSEIIVILRKINLFLACLLTAMAFSTLSAPFYDTWIYLPVFKFHLLDPDKQIHVFVHAFLFFINIGFYFQLFVIAFSWMIYLSAKRIISFQFLYLIVILRSALILVQMNINTTNYFDFVTSSLPMVIHVFYIIVFLTMFILNSIYDEKKKPRIRESYELEKE